MSTESQTAVANPSQSGVPAGTNFIFTGQTRGGDAPENKEDKPDPAKPATDQTAAKTPLAVELDVPKTPEVPNPNAADTTQAFEYDSTGDASLDYALGFVGKQGFGPDHPAIQAAQQGNFSLLKAELATKGVTGADAVVALAEQAYARHTKEAEAKSAELSAYAEKAAGGSAQWATVRDWAAKEATPQEKAEVNAALARGGIVAQGVITQLVSMYQSKHTLNKEPAQVARSGAAGSQGPSGAPVTAAEFAKQSLELYAKYGPRADETPEYAALTAQRIAARRQGI